MGPVVLLDANVLWGAGLRDLLLTLSEVTERFQPRWTKQILDETTQNVLRDRPHLKVEQMERLTREMNLAFDDAMVSGYEHLIEQMTNDPGDRHVLAAAAHAEADLLLTFNLRHFPDEACRPHGVRAMSPDEFLCQLFEEAPGDVLRAMNIQAANIESTVPALIGNLERSVPRFTALVRATLRGNI